jgi:hypothetical protein
MGEDRNDEETVWSLKKPTPLWAAWLFRIVFFSTTALTIVVAGDAEIKDKIKVRIFLYMKGLDAIVWGIARGLGVSKKAFENEN